MTYLAVPIKVESPEQAKSSVKQACDAKAELLELRFDYLESYSCETVAAIVKDAIQAGKPIIATCRAGYEGGKFTGDEPERIELLQAAAQAGADYIDIELAALTDGVPDFGDEKKQNVQPA